MLTAKAGSGDVYSTERKKYSLLAWVPSLYISMGFPGVIVGVVSAIIYKNLGVSNNDIAIFTSQLYLPWVLKPLWAPFLDVFRTKRFWLIGMQFLMTALFGLVAFSLCHEKFFAFSLILFWTIGFASATQDVVIDGIFMSEANAKEQAGYAGLQGMCWNLGSVLGAGVIVSLAGTLHDSARLTWQESWTLIMACVACVMALTALWHARAVPLGAPNRFHISGGPSQRASTRIAWKSFFKSRRSEP